MTDTVVEIKRQNGVAHIKTLGGETLRVPSALYAERPLRAGQAVDLDGYRQYLLEKSDGFALEAAMKYLALRERSEKEVRDRLRRSCYDEGTVDRVLAVLKNHGLISDSRFAEQWAHSRARKYGKNRIAQELRFKGISGPEAQAALDAVPKEEEYQRALDQARRLCKKFQNDPNKIAQSLARKGYAWQLARRAAQEAARE